VMQNVHVFVAFEDVMNISKTGEYLLPVYTE